MILGARQASCDPNDPAQWRCQWGTCRWPQPTISDPFISLGLQLFARCADQFVKTDMPLGFGVTWPIRDYIPIERIEKEAALCGIELDDDLSDFVKHCAATVREDDIDSLPSG